MVVTYRDTEVAPASLTANVIVGLARGLGRHRCELTGLSQDSVARWLDAAGLAGVHPAQLHARTGGNPLFISESIQLLTAGSRPGTPLRSVGEVIRERLAPLPPACREALEVASVLGRDFEYPPLAAALRISPAAAVAALDPAVNARLIGPVSDRAGLTASSTRSSGTRWRSNSPLPGAPNCTPGPSPRCATPAGVRRPTWLIMPCRAGQA